MKRKLTRAHLRRIILQEAAPIIRRRPAAPVAATELPTGSEVEDLSLDAKKAYDASEDKETFMIGYNEGADDATYDKPYNPKYKPVEPKPGTGMDDFKLGYSHGYSDMNSSEGDYHLGSDLSDPRDIEVPAASHFMGEGRRAKQLTRAQLRSLLQEMYGMSGQDMRDSGRLREELTSKLYGILSGMRMDSNDISMFSSALESALAHAHSVIKGEDQDYQVTIAPASQLTRDFASSGMLSEEYEPSSLVKRDALAQNFEDEMHWTVDVLRGRLKQAEQKFPALRIASTLLDCPHLDRGTILEFMVAAELDHGMTGIIDHVLGVDV